MSTAPPAMYVVKWCPCSRCTVGVLAGNTPTCLDAKGGIKAKAPTPFCGCWSVVLSMSLVCASKHVQRDFHCIALVRVSCLTQTLDSWSLECEISYKF